MNMDDARRYVAAGAEVLTADLGDGWKSRLDRDRLDVRSIRDCPLSQLYGGYSHAVDRLSGLPSYGDASSAWAEEHGFESFNVVREEYDMLTEAWKEYLSAV